MKNYPGIPGYEIIREIGKGGMATVYLAYEEKLDRKVALKVLLKSHAEKETFTTRFLKEAKTAANLHHTNIVSIYDVGETGKDIYYFTMEYLPVSLFDKLKSGKLEPKKALGITKDIAKALSYAHKKGFIHRDIKPDNILFRNDGTPILVDFGIARAIKSVSKLTETGTSIGTPEYMSPEQGLGENIDERTDIYSLGAVLYKMLSGQPPYKAKNKIGVIIKHIHDPVPELPEELEYYQPLINKMMAKNPINRPANIDQVIELLDVFIEEQKTVLFDTKDRVATDLIKKSKTIEYNNENIQTAELKKEKPKKRFKYIFPFIIIIAILISLYLITNKNKEKPSVQDKPTISKKEEIETKNKKNSKNEFNKHFSLAKLNYRKGRYWLALRNINKAKQVTSTYELGVLEEKVRTKLKEQRNKVKSSRENKEQYRKLKQSAELNFKNKNYKQALKNITLAKKIDSDPELENLEKKVESELEPSLIEKKKHQYMGIEWIKIPSGSFMMGSKEGLTSEKPVHEVYLDEYYISKTEITFALYDKFCEQTKKDKPDDNGWGRNNRPVINVSWNDAIDFCEWISEQIGENVHLPTEAQWEKSAKNNRLYKFPWGNQPPDGEKANFADKNTDFKWKDKTIDDGYKFTAPVGKYPQGASPYGLLDMAGNVSEWCLDKYNDDYYKKSSLKNPKGPENGSGYIYRGGSWNSYSRYLQTTIRNWADKKYTSNDLGFRIVKDKTNSN